MSAVTDRVRNSRLGALSLRTQLVMLTGLLLVLAIAVMGLVSISALRAQLVSQMDSDMSANASSLARSLGQRGGGEDSAQDSQYAAYLLDADGNVVDSANTSHLDSTPVLTGWSHNTVDRFSGQGFTVPGVGGGTQWRIKPFSLSGTDKSMIVASPLNRVEQTVALVGMLTLAFGLATLLAAIALGWVLVTRAFEPLARVERTAARIAAGDLSQRIERYNPRTELGRLSMSLNVMLTRIEEAFDARKRSEVKMRRFVGDASHELRTPLVTIRGYSELYRHGALQSEEDIAKAMSRIEAESVRMGRLVEDLLMLARLDENRPGESQRVDLLELAQDAADDAEASAPDREVRVVGLEDGPALPAPVFGDEARLRQVLANLVTNAIRYTPAGSPIELAVGVQPGIDGGFVSVLKVVDHGPGIEGEEAEKVFQRFYRADTSRTRETGGTGLGLAIVAAIVDQHHGTVRVEQTPGGGASMVVRIPQLRTDADVAALDPHSGEIRE